MLSLYGDSGHGITAFILGGDTKDVNLQELFNSFSILPQ